MSLTAVLCTDGSELAIGALRHGLAVLGELDRVVVATAIDPVDPALAIGGGHAGPVMSPADAQDLEDDRRRGAQVLLDETVAALGLENAETVIVYGGAGSALCDLAALLPASVMVLGTRGRGGFRRAVMGSVSDHIVRNAPCPVITTTLDDGD